MSAKVQELTTTRSSESGDTRNSGQFSQMPYHVFDKSQVTAKFTSEWLEQTKATSTNERMIS